MSAPGYSNPPGWYSRFILEPLGLNKENDVVFWLIFLFGGLLLCSFWYSQGNIWIALSSLLLVSVVVLTILRADYSLYLLLFSVIIFEQFRIPGFDFFPSHVSYFSSITEIPYFSYLPLNIFSALELHFLLICFSTFLMLSLKFGPRWRPIPAAIPYTIFLTTIIGAIVYGIQKSGSISIALWESRAILYFLLLYFMVPQIIQSKRQIRALFWILITAVSIKALYLVYWYINSGYLQGNSHMLIGSENALFLVTMLVMGISVISISVKDKQKWVLLALLPFVLIGFYAVAAEVAYFSLAVSIAVFCFLVPATARKRFILLISPFLIAVVVYSAIFTGSNEWVDLRKEQAKIESMWKKAEQFFADVDSKLYQEVKLYNISDLLRESPIIGTGFGYKAEHKVVSTDVLTVREKIPQNQSLWLLLKAGIPGLLAFTFLFTTYLAKAVKLLSSVTDPYLGIILRVIVVVVVYQLIIQFFEPQLLYYRSMIFLGCLMGLYPAINKTTFKKTGTANKSKAKQNRLEGRAVNNKISKTFN